MIPFDRLRVPGIFVHEIPIHEMKVAVKHIWAAIRIVGKDDGIAIDSTEGFRGLQHGCMEEKFTVKDRSCAEILDDHPVVQDGEVHQFSQFQAIDEALQRRPTPSRGQHYGDSQAATML